MIRFVKALLRRLHVEDPAMEWEEWLPQVAFAINSSVARSTGMSPNQVFFGTNLAPFVQPDEELPPPQLRDATEESVNQYAQAIHQKI